MSKSIPNVDWANQLESVIRQFVKEKLELNEKWAGRKLRGFAEAHEALQRMFEERYN
ncbi:hypothetical protein [Anoxybacillus flavithermus]|uniref:hypothetical protein n=1 Tax=Anoxybacillus flavithermus TaxID=33934 RepID=UPI001F51367F|nr:hypothetical protein [Anoxybacillus flavithermus]MBE2930585.1 hypothetical protein [Anoxybacillus flavithermus]MBE2957585.1 hypothetical protein [Anoxybacillus flavithermus]